MYRHDRGLIWEVIFQFPTNHNTGRPDGESVVWSRYATTAADVHAVGKKREVVRQTTKPGVKYRGFIQGNAGLIRALVTKRGHGFAVVHEPAEGIYHAEITYAPALGETLSKGDKGELKLMLRNIFSELILPPQAA